jgi:hypothetical protein
MIIGISGKIGSGKDLVGQIMQVISCDAPDYINTDKIHDIKSVLNWLNSNEDTPWEEMMFPDHKVTKNFLSKHETVEIKKFADKLKDIVCLLIGCTREQLEDREFKEKELGEEWDQYEGDALYKQYTGSRNGFDELLFNSKGNFKPVIENPIMIAEELRFRYIAQIGDTFKLTPRKLLQLLGTECGREIIHPQIWVNALFADYEKDSEWIVTDVRFPNEAQAIKDKGGIVIRVNRYCYDSLEDYLVTHPNKKVSEKAVKIVSDWGLNKHGVMEEKLKEIPESKDYYNKSNHPSETALDNYEFDEVIENNGSIEELIEKVKKLNII